jgi:8-oxo-dGTP pyrophosphatase MutT (NUDIX family)
MDPSTPTEFVRAAGGLILRRQDGRLQIVLVHRPLQKDWSYPKGKLEPGETLEAAAQREVREETGLVCRLLQFVGETEYVDRKGRPKVVAYWLMVPEAGSFAVNDEVDELQWLDLPVALPRLSYERDRELLASLAADGQLETLF